MDRIRYGMFAFLVSILIIVPAAGDSLAAGHNLTDSSVNRQTINLNTFSSGNYTAILSAGQTPYQIGIFFRGEPANGGYTSWSWWDGMFGQEKQKNLITLMVFDNSSGTAKPLTELITPPTYPQVTRRNHSANYSYKADTADPTITYRYDPGGKIVYAENNYENNVDLWMIKEINLTGVVSANLTFWTWYVIETNWDYGYVSVSTDNSNSWINLPGSLTTNTNPNGNNDGNGITGNSNGWKLETMDLTPYAGKNILIRFRFKSDAAVNEEGWYIDDIKVTAGNQILFSDDAETPIETRTLSVNVTYPKLTLINITDPLTDATILQYTQRTQQVDLIKDTGHPGTYYGYFVYTPPEA